MHTERWRRRGLPYLLLSILAVALAYYLGGRVGLLQRVVLAGAQVTPLWLPTGIAVAALLWLGPRIWPGIALGTFCVMQTLGPFEPVGLAIVAGNTLAPLCAYAMLRRVDFRTEMDRLRDGLALVFLGGLLPMLISATVGAGVLALSGSLPASGFWPVWWSWWAGDAMGVLVVTPLLLVLPRFRLTPDLYRLAEGAALAVTAVAVTLLVTHSSLSLLFLVFPLLIWAAVRFQLPGAAPCSLLISVVAIAAATDRAGPFEDHSLFEIMANLMALNGSAALTALLLSAMVTEQQNIRRKIEQACVELAELVARLSQP
ncbi:MASE1 domain-containing protein [Streptomyces sp. H27-H5]|uniref:MASE1 domain-containing protein n=1 Tax=Streptomyces sp. H27-H5 TaxID=2996460 RepID=UPI002270DA0E|nr:MASE1 domain-containing protein [Streptomyces sp. H27-H5]MCY0956910.1 MASE1 domain-containing protein [Streptomyces sp. H27-H5]